MMAAGSDSFRGAIGATLPPTSNPVVTYLEYASPMPAEPMTTIKVPKPLRARIAREAALSGRTAAAVITELLDENDRRARLAAVRRAYESAGADYAAETAEWDAVSADGLDP